MNGTIKYEIYSGLAIAIENKLKQLGIEYSLQFKTSSVPCQIQIILHIVFKSELEWFAITGIINSSKKVLTGEE